MEKTLRVTGKGKLSVKPDTIRLNINLEDTCNDYEVTLERSVKAAETLKDMIETLGFDRRALKTVHFNINTVYESYQDKDKGWKQRLTGYKSAHRMKLEFETDNKRLGKLLYALAHCPVSPEFVIEYTIANPETAKTELLGRAVKDSFEKAKVLAAAAGVGLGDIISIDYTWGEVDFVTRPVNELALKSRSGVAPEACYDIDIEADDINVSDTVTVVWSIAPVQRD